MPAVPVLVQVRAGQCLVVEQDRVEADRCGSWRRLSGGWLQCDCAGVASPVSIPPEAAERGTKPVTNISAPGSELRTGRVPQMARGVGGCQPFHNGQIESGAGTMIDRPQPCDLVGEAVGLCDRDNDRVYPHPRAGGTRGRDKTRQHPAATLRLRDQPLLWWLIIGP